jgi:four helix bundle protein
MEYWVLGTGYGVSRGHVQGEVGVHDFRRLEVWHEGLDLAEVMYGVTRTLPDSERFGLSGQIRRASVSVSSNIAEGASRGTPKEMARFLRNAMGSLSELETQIELCARLGLLDDTER